MPSVTSTGLTSPKSLFAHAERRPSDAKTSTCRRQATISFGGCDRIFIGIIRLGSTCRPSTAATSGAVARVGLAVGSAVDADHRKNNDGRGLGIRVDIFAAARTQLVGKSDDLAHCKFPLTVRVPPRGCRRGAFSQLKDLQG